MQRSAKMQSAESRALFSRHRTAHCVPCRGEMEDEGNRSFLRLLCPLRRIDAVGNDLRSRGFHRNVPALRHNDDGCVEMATCLARLVPLRVASTA
jgi:hypothetical protein